MKKETGSLQEIAEIRLLMEKSTRFLSLSGLSGISAGIIALIGTLVAFFGLDYDMRYFNPRAYFETLYFEPLSKYIWFIILDASIVFILASTAGIYFSFRKAKRAGVKFWDKTAKRLLINLATPLFVGAVFCTALLHYKLFFLIGATTLIFYGLALIHWSKFTFHEIRFLGYFEILLGFTGLFLPGYTIILWGIGFGFLHIIYGAVMFYRHER